MEKCLRKPVKKILCIWKTESNFLQFGQVTYRKMNAKPITDNGNNETSVLGYFTAYSHYSILIWLDESKIEEF